MAKELNQNQKCCSLVYKAVNSSAKRDKRADHLKKYMAEIVEDNPTEEVNNLSDEELEERFERDLELFKKTLSRLSSE